GGVPGGSLGLTTLWEQLPRLVAMSASVARASSLSFIVAPTRSGVERWGESLEPRRCHSATGSVNGGISALHGSAPGTSRAGRVAGAYTNGRPHVGPADREMVEAAGIEPASERSSAESPTGVSDLR